MLPGGWTSAKKEAGKCDKGSCSLCTLLAISDETSLPLLFSVLNRGPTDNIGSQVCTWDESTTEGLIIEALADARVLSGALP